MLDGDQYFNAEAGNEVILLFIAEDKDVGDMLAQPMIQKGYLCEVAVNMEQALEWMNSLSPDIILLDFYMENGNGLEFMKALRQQSVSENTPVLFFSQVPEEYVQEAQQYGPYDCIEAAYDGDALSQKIEEMIN